MSAPLRTRVTLYLAAGLDPIRGELEYDDQRVVPFAGWLQLAQALTAVVSPGSAEVTNGDTGTA